MQNKASVTLLKGHIHRIGQRSHSKDRSKVTGTELVYTCYQYCPGYLINTSRDPECFKGGDVLFYFFSQQIILQSIEGANFFSMGIHTSIMKRTQYATKCHLNGVLLVSL